MKYSLALVAAGVATAAAEAFTLAECGQTCNNNMMTLAQTTFNCKKGDVKCYCNDSRYGAWLGSCSEQHCGNATLAALSIAFGIAFCDQAGSGSPAASALAAVSTIPATDASSASAAGSSAAAAAATAGGFTSGSMTGPSTGSATTTGGLASPTGTFPTNGTALAGFTGGTGVSSASTASSTGTPTASASGSSSGSMMTTTATSTAPAGAASSSSSSSKGAAAVQTAGPILGAAALAALALL